MLNLPKRLYINRKSFLYLFKIIYFNFHYLPFKQAIHLPIVLYKPHFGKLKGSIEIKSNNIYFGMIRLGVDSVEIYPQDGIYINISKGKVIFNDGIKIGNHSFISVFGGNLVFGENFEASAGLKIQCSKNILFDNYVSIGYDCMIADTSHHKIKLIEKNEIIPTTGDIIIGSHVWISSQTTIYKNTIIPNNIIVASHSLLNKDYSNVSDYSLIAGIPAKLKKEGVMRMDFYNYKCLSD